MAVPSMLIVAPRGITKEEMSLSAPSSSAHSLLRGIVAAEEVEVKAKIIAGAAPLKNLSGLTPTKALAETE